MEGDLIILGAGGKMGPSLSRLARRALDESGVAKRIIAVARFTNPGLRQQLEATGVQTIACDLLSPGALQELPSIANVIFMAARKFGTTGAEHLTWAMNTYLPGLVAERYRESRIVAFSSGNVYPLRPIHLGGASESEPTRPVGEYAQSALGRERMFEYGSNVFGTPVCILRLNYAIDLRYGVLVDIASAVHEGRPVDLTMGVVNVIWQRDANSVCLRALQHCSSAPLVLNVTGPETIAVRYLTEEFAKRFNKPAIFAGTEAPTALLSNASVMCKLFGYPSVTLGEMIDETASWISRGGPVHGKPTQFQVRDGAF
jgi:nucleoside-diphosphate-sugar epimerase